ncbi:hypothetical protein [Streptomyces glaucescens]|uniref:hypothetical protein n=1 Tax=Streptomyces glaucescens TaxID=1907 RepID=UPI000A3CD89C|nr:hypothetical protein [Streptomyces glaucescens]
MKYGSWVAGAASAAVLVGLTLYVDASETGHTDGGLQVDTRAPGAAASPQGRVGSRPGPDASSEGTDDTPLFRTLARIGELAAGPHADVYPGLAVDEARGAAEVWRIPSAALEEAVCAAAEKGVTVRFHDTDVSRTELEAPAQRIGEDMNRWDGAFQLLEVAIVERGFVTVGVDDLGAARPLVEGAFGTEPLEVVQVHEATFD